MNLTFYKFYKKQNSTKQPTDKNSLKWEVDNVKLKDDTSLYSPSFLVNNVPFSITTNTYTYLKWEDRYYFIDDIIKPTINNLWEVKCTFDKLATYKDVILSNTTAFVKYSTNNYDPFIPDSRLSYSHLDYLTFDHVNFESFDTEPNIVVSYISAKDSGYGSMAYAILTAEQLQQLNAYLMSTGFQDSLNKQIDSTASAIVDCLLFPFTLFGTEGTASMNILGVDTNIQCKLIKDIGIKKNTIKVNVPKVNDFRDLPPYTNYMMFLPGYGYVEIPGYYIESRQGEDKYIEIDYIIDKLTGGLSYNIDGIGKFDGTIAVHIPTAYSGINAINTIHSGANTIKGIGNLLTSPSFDSLVDTAVSGFDTYIAFNMQNCGTIGSNSGSRASIFINPYDIGNGVLSIVLYKSRLKGTIDPVDIAQTLGRPCNKVLQLSKCTGYVQTANASCELNAPKNIIDEINAMLNSGIYIE